MFQTIFQIILVSLVPIVGTTVFGFLQHYTRFKYLPRKYIYLITGIIFGGMSILGTVFGVKTTEGSIINVRDAAPIIAGLMFGGPSGIIAGFIGGLYRFVSVYWGGSGAFTQWACSISTLLAGIFTAIVRKFIFDNHHGTWYYGLFLGIFIEDFHMMMIFLTHLNEVTRAYDVINQCALIMISLNSITVAISLVIVALIHKEPLIKKDKKMHISTHIQMTLAISLVLAYLCTSLFTYGVLLNVVNTQTNDSITSVMEDVTDEFKNKINNYYIDLLDEAKTTIDDDIANGRNLNNSINTLKENLSISEVNIVDSNGIIKYTTHEDYLNYDMNSAPQTKEFMILVNNGIDVYIQDLREGVSGGEKARYGGATLARNSLNLSFVQIGLYEKAYYSLLESHIIGFADYRHINKEGFVAISDGEGKILSSTIGMPIAVGDKLNLGDFVIDGETEYSIEKDKTYSYYVDTAYREGFYLFGFAEKGECDLPIQVSFLGITLAEIFIFIMLFGVLYIVIKRRVTDKVKVVCNGLNNISNGNLNVEIHEESTYEFAKLSEDINTTVKTLKDYISKEALKNAEELEFAKSIQHSALPTLFPLNDIFEIYALMNTAKQVGGDFYDFYYIDREHMLIQIADVSGKGIPAAMFMMQSKTILKSLLETGLDIAEAYSEANRRISQGNDAQMFVTAWAGIIDLTNGHVEYVNAGHNPPLIGHSDGTVEYLKGRSGFVLAGIDNYKYSKQSFDIKPGDYIFLYTDGVTEANDCNKQLYGEDRLLHVLNGALGSSKELVDRVSGDLKVYVGEAEQSDDITMLCFKLYSKDKNQFLVTEAISSNIERITRFVDNVLDKNGASEKAKMQIDVAIDEIISNICFYAYKDGQVGKVKVGVSYDDESQNITINFEDRGIKYNPLEKDDPNIHESLAQRKIGGLGIFIVKQTMDDVQYVNINDHNVLTIVKKIK